MQFRRSVCCFERCVYIYFRNVHLVFRRSVYVYCFERCVYIVFRRRVCNLGGVCPALRGVCILNVFERCV